jgi:hypothetical protein
MGRASRVFYAVLLPVLLSGCGIIDAIRDRPLISEMGILQSRKENERRLQQEQNNAMTGQQPCPSIAAPSMGSAANSCTRISPEEMTETAIGETHVRIHLYMKEHREVPPNLSVLPQRKGYANRITDGWGRELHYSVDDKGIISLSSLGADGKPGGDGPNRDFVHRYETRNADGSLNIDDKFWAIREISASQP